MCLKVNKICVECFSKKPKKNCYFKLLAYSDFLADFYTVLYQVSLWLFTRSFVTYPQRQPAQPNMKTFSIFAIVRIFFTFSILFAWKPTAFLFNFHFTKVLNQSPSLRLIFVIKFVLCFHLLHSNPLHYYK